MNEHQAAETHGFQAEVKQLLHLVIHSLYSNREIFLRELISNASDANDRLRFAALEDPAQLEGDTDLRIEVSIDPEQGLLAVSDNGIGMSRQEVVENLGTIARSGTGEFLSRLSGEKQKDAQLIGQFGVGFYSAFTVASEVEVLSRRAGAASEDAVRWVSKGENEYSLGPASRPARGTTVTLKLREDAREFLEPLRIRALIRRYSDHIAFPVSLRVIAAERGEAEVVNRAKALWTRARTEISPEEYREFYKHIAHDAADPLAWSHNRVEGKREYTSLIYIPATAPFDLWNRERPRGLKLYVNRVFVTEEATQFLPLYLRFVRGIVDSSDLSLNVSRELLQQDANVAAIRSALTKRVLDMLENLAAEESEKYAVFWEQFGNVLKEGIAEDLSNQDRIAGLLRFASTRSEGDTQSRSLKQYLGERGAAQKTIYFLTGESLATVRANPHLEVFRKHDIEVLLLVDRIDEWLIQHLPSYQDVPLRDVARGMLDLDVGEGAETKAPDLSKDQKHVLKRIKRVLKDQVQEVRSSNRLTESAACLVLADQDMGYQLQELLRAAGHEAPEVVPSLELNLSHPLLRQLEQEQDEARFEDLARLLYGEATLAEGRLPKDSAAFISSLNRLLLVPAAASSAPGSIDSADGGE
jgi:molecular chaperone HtpG